MYRLKVLREQLRERAILLIDIPSCNALRIWSSFLDKGFSSFLVWLPFGRPTSFYLCGKSESECQHFGLYVITQTVSVFDGPDLAAAAHAKTEYLHDHIQIPSQPAQLATNNHVPFVYLFYQFAQSPLLICPCSGNRFLNPYVNGYSLQKAKLLNFETLVFYCLFVAAYANVSVYIILYIFIYSYNSVVY